MKKLPILLLSLLTLPVYAQSILNTLNQHQSNLKPAESNNGTSSTSANSTPDVKPSGESVSSTATKCEESDQTSIPLAYITSLILEKDGALDISHKASQGALEVKAPKFISNCNSMIEWKLKKPEIQGQKAYALEAVIKRGDVCNVDGTCSYKVKRVENGDFKEFQNMNFNPTLKGFEECLQKSGVIVGGKVVPTAIADEPLYEKFTNLDNSGKLLFLSHGPSSPLIKAKHGKFEFQNGCDYYENPSAKPTVLLTVGDAEKERLDAEAAKLRECKVDEYQKIADFIDKYQAYADELGEVRDRLILEAVKKSAENLTKGKYTAEDLKVLDDFRTHIVDPKVALAVSLYEESLDMEGDAKLAKQEELKQVLAQLAALQKAPYFLPEHITKLIKDGKFDEATKLNTTMLVLQNHQSLGTQVLGTVITPGVASQRTLNSVRLFAQSMEEEKLKYMHRTGQVNTEPAKYQTEAAMWRDKIQENNTYATQKIQEQFQLIQQPNGHCYKYWVNTQQCVADAQSTITNYVTWLQEQNTAAAKNANAADAKAKEWGALAAEGRRYIATTTGEVIPEPEVPATTQPQTQPNTNFYNFSQGQGQQQPGQQQPGQQQYFNYQAAMQSFQQPQQQYQQPGMFQQQQNPYAPYMGGQQQQPFMGQTSYGYQPQSPYGYQQPQNQYGYQAGGLFNFNFGLGSQQYGQQYGGYQQQQPYSYGGYQQTPYAGNNQQASYWYRPYQAYNQYSLYGR